MMHGEDIAAVVVARWATDTTLATLVPGGLWKDRADHDAVEPYAVVTVEEGEPQWYSSPDYLQPFTFAITVYGLTGAVDLSTIRRRLDVLFDRDARALFYPAAGTFRTVDLRYLPGKTETNPAPNQGQHVSVTLGRWEALIQASRTTTVTFTA